MFYPDHTPYDPADPYWLFKEVAAFEREFVRNVQGPMLLAMCHKVDCMWDEAIAKANAKQDK